MPAIFPFRAIRYSSEKAPALDRVVSPPYDVISPQGQEALYKKSTYNFIRIVYGKTRKTDRPGQDRYSRARELFSDWFQEGILRMDARPALYPYRQRFSVNAEGKDKVFDRWGILGLIRLGDSSIFPHENTYAGPKQDRLHLMAAVQANLSPIFGLVDDSDQKYQSLLSKVAGPPLMSVNHEGIRHEVWRVAQPGFMHRLQTALETKAMLIADGHHRYEVAVQYRDLLKRSAPQFHSNHPANFMLIDVAGFSDQDPGLLPTHRVFDGLDTLGLENLKALAGAGLNFIAVPDEPAMIREVERLSRAGKIALGCATRSEGYAVIAQEPPFPEGIRLDVELLHGIIVPRHLAKTENEQHLRIAYTHEWKQASDWVRGGQGKLAWYTQAPTFNQIIECVRLGKRLPQKSTSFVPKPLAGLVVHRLRHSGRHSGTISGSAGFGTGTLVMSAEPGTPGNGTGDIGES
ncbi:MAG: DUF1015 domain-containing protein [Candidatus Omnitrophica bacterium]|nr:DUF1015 domain-containing protein [Candidatus Omnitrophota bacterium]